MTRVNIDILGISELKWAGMDEFNSDDHYIYHCGQESLRRNGVAIIVNKRAQMQYLDAMSKTTEWSLFISKAKDSISQQSKSMLQPVMLKKLKLRVLLRPTRRFRTNTQKRCPFHYKGLECKSRKSRNTWSNKQIWLWSTEWSRAKANTDLPRKCTGHRKHPLPTTQEKTLHMDITRWSTLKSDWLYSFQPKMEKLYTVSKKKSSGRELTVAQIMNTKFRLKLKKMGKPLDHLGMT